MEYKFRGPGLLTTDISPPTRCEGKWRSIG